MTTSPTVTLVRAGWNDPRVAALRAAMDAEVAPRYADAPRGEGPPPVDVADVVATVLALAGDEPVGTAALKRTGAHAEVKRVFVAPAGRNRRLGARLLAAVEQVAREAGYAEVHLQTGYLQPDAHRLYEREGWRPVAPFGPYEKDTVISRCYAKSLTPLLVAAALSPVIDADAAIASLRALDDAGVDLALLDDDYLAGAVDAPTVAAVAASRTARIGLVPRVRVTHTEPFHLAKVVQTLDWTSAGRAGWLVGVSLSDAEAAAFGRRTAPDAAEAWAEARDVVEVSRRLWDSWEDDAEIRDVATGRFVDKDKIHYVDFEGERFSVKGPSIVPRSPQGQVPVVVEVSGADDDPALAVAVRDADVVRVRAVAGLAGAVGRVRAALEAAGRPDVPVLAGLDVTALAAAEPPAPHAADPGERLAGVLAGWRTATGADGVVLTGTVADVEAAARVAAEVQPEPVEPNEPADAPAAVGHTLRERLGLPRPASRYATQPEQETAR
ncbi:LLM class flavin-dependent oxidoreductase [Promicromonospora sukumoe]|uniref:LLM class flavin-dependent oxidoreductase n=1 Tax=Promicromonospora sukumoe TaxID=88382 RepID=UPI0037C7A99A